MNVRMLARLLWPPWRQVKRRLWRKKDVFHNCSSFAHANGLKTINAFQIDNRFEWQPTPWDQNDTPINASVTWGVASVPKKTQRGAHEFPLPYFDNTFTNPYKLPPRLARPEVIKNQLQRDHRIGIKCNVLHQLPGVFFVCFKAAVAPSYA